MVEDKVYAERSAGGAKMTNTGCSEVAVVTGNRGPLNGLKYTKVGLSDFQENGDKCWYYYYLSFSVLSLNFAPAQWEVSSVDSICIFKIL